LGADPLRNLVDTEPGLVCWYWSHCHLFQPRLQLFQDPPFFLLFRIQSKRLRNSPVSALVHGIDHRPYVEQIGRDGLV
jgi:hypothetical protein